MSATGNERLVFDLGLFDGGDTAYYLSRGCRVVSVDADPKAIEAAEQQLARELADGRLALVHAALVGDDRPSVQLHLSSRSVWSSMHAAVAEREAAVLATIDVPATTLPALIDRYGDPYYVKIDIEGMDAEVLRSLAPTPFRPRYVSAETECGGAEVPSEDEALETLDVLVDLGYTGFKLVDQNGLGVVGAAAEHAPLFHRVAHRLRGRQPAEFAQADGRWHAFPLGSTGPFGEELAGEWVDAATGRELLLRERARYFASPGAVPYGFWYDWHARFE